MADNVTTQSSTLATIPASTKISTDEDATNGHVQRMKLAVSADGSSTHVGADANGLQVQGAAADGAAVTGNPVLIGGDDGTNAVNIAVDSDGAVHVSDGGNTLTVDGTVTANAGTGTFTVDGSGVTQPVSGTVTANLSATDNAVLDTIEVNTSYGDNTGGGVEAGALRVTIANDSTGVLSVDDNGGSLTVDGAVSITSGNTISTNNSTTTPLGISGNYTGTGEDLTGYAAVSITLYADVASATDGMTFEFSTDNTNWDDVYTFTMSAGDARRFQFPVTAQYFRVNYTNGGTGQSAFRVQTILHTDSINTTVHRLVDSTGPDRSATLVKAAIVAQQSGSGNFIPVSSSASGKLQVAAEIEDGGNSITVDNGGTFATQATLQANSGVDIGDVDVTSVVPGTGATNLGKAEDAAHTTGDTGVMALAVRNDAGTALAGTTGDYIPLGTDASGNLYVNVAAGSASGTEYTEDDAAAANPAGPTPTFVRQDTPATLTSTDGDVVAGRATNYGAQFVQVVDSSGNFINSFGGSGGTSHADDAAFSIGSASSITPAGFLADDTTPDSVDEGDVGVPRMTLTRKPYAVITDATSENNAAVDGSGHLQVDIAASSATVTVAAHDVTNAGTFAVQEDGAALTALQLIDDVVATDDTSTHATGTTKGAVIMAAATPTDGSVDANDLGALAMSTDRRLLVDAQLVGQDADITIADGGNTITVDGTVTANAGTGTFTVDLGANNDIQGQVADDAAASGNPVLIAGYAIETDGTDPGEVSAEGDAAQLRTDLNRRLLVNQAHPNLWIASGLYTTTQTDTSVKAAPGANLSLYITDVTVSTDTAFNCFFEHGTTKVIGTLYLAANGGMTASFTTPIRLPANTALTFTSSATANHSVQVHGYTAP